jgi:hypothetical protein
MGSKEYAQIYLSLPNNEKEDYLVEVLDLFILEFGEIVVKSKIKDPHIIYNIFKKMELRWVEVCREIKQFHFFRVYRETIRKFHRDVFNVLLIGENNLK